MKELLRNSKQALLITLIMFILCGLVYPFAVTGIAQAFFSHKANGSMIELDQKMIGSELLGQAFTSPEYFTGRVSSINYNMYTKEDTVPNSDGEKIYNGVGSGTFNYAPSNPELVKRMEADIKAFLKANPTVKREEIPADLMTASGSGLDPHISVEAALIQVDRVAQASGLSVAEVKEVIKTNTDSRLLAFIGEDKVNVLTANLAILHKMQAR